MSLVSTNPAERLGTDIKPLPDGRTRLTVREEMPIGFRVTDDAMTAYGTLIDKPLTGKYTRAAAAYLIDQDFVNQGGTTIRIRVYETLHATAEVQVGKLSYVTDEDGRSRAQARFLQLASATRTPGTIGTTTAPDDSAEILAREEIENDGAVRRITRFYNQTNATAGTADAIGPVIISYPFNQVGDATHVIASQVFEQPSTHYAPLTLGATRSVTVNNAAQTLYYIGDVLPPGRQGATLLRFTRQWANKPSTRDEYETVAATFPGIGASQAEFEAELRVKVRNGFTKIVVSKLTYTYYRIAAAGGDYTSPDSIPLDTVQTYTKPGFLNTDMSPTQIYLSDIDTIAFIAVGGAIFKNLLTVPTRTAYFALGTYGLVLRSDLQRYAGNFYVRITRRVTAI
jgi:hypothetical protein